MILDCRRESTFQAFLLALAESPKVRFARVNHRAEPLAKVKKVICQGRRPPITPGKSQ